MAKVLINDSTLTGIANAIREKAGTTAQMLPSAMASAISAIQVGGSSGSETVSSWIDEYLVTTLDIEADISSISEFCGLVESTIRDGLSGAWDLSVIWLFKIDDSNSDFIDGYITNTIAWFNAYNATSASINIGFKRSTGAFGFNSTSIAYSNPTYASRNTGIHAGATIKCYKIPFFEEG